MASPLHYFRKHQGYILAVLGVILIVTWVVGPFLLDLFEAAPNSVRPKAKGNVVAHWKKGDITRNELQRMAYEHEGVLRFLSAVVKRAQEEGGTPQAPFQQTNEQGQIVSFGIPTNIADLTLIDLMFLADKGAELGVQFDHAAVLEYLKNLSGFTLVSEDDFAALARSSLSEMRDPDKKIPLVTTAQLFERLKVELTALQAKEMIVSGLGGYSTGELWEYHEQLHCRYKIEAFPLEVAAYKDRFKATDAKEEDLKKIYQEGKERVANPEANEPGFRTPLRLAFGYVKVDFQKFLDEAKKQISEEQVAAEYEKEIQAGNFRKPTLNATLPDRPLDGKAPAADPMTPGKEKTPADDEKPAPPAAKPDEGPAKSPDGNGKTESKTQESPDKSKEGGKDSSKPPAETKEPPKSDDSSPRPEGECQDAEKAADAGKDSPATPESGKSDPAKAPPTGEDDKKPTSDAGETKSSNDDSKVKEPEFRPLSEVREQIISKLARPAAQAAQEAAIKAVTRAVQDFGSKHTLWVESTKSGNKASVKNPGELRIRSLADKYHLTIGDVPLSDRFEVASTELGSQAGYQDLRETIPFATIAYFDDRPLYAPQQLDSMVGEATYIYWRTQKEPSVVLPYDKARPQVVEAWIKQRAVEAARKDAEALADKARKAGSLQEALSEEQAKRIVQPLPFTWLTRSGLPIYLAQAPPRLSEVAGIPLAGEEFMKAVFGLRVGQSGVAVNQPHTTVYVVRIVADEPALDIRREMFLSSVQASAFGDLALYARIERQRFGNKMFQSLRDDYQLEWVESPQNEPDL